MSAHNEQPAAAQEAVAWVPPSFFDNGVVAATARRKPPSETAVAMRGEYVPLYAAPVAAAPVGSLVAEMRNFADVADSCQITEGNAGAAIRSWADRLATGTPAAPGIDPALQIVFAKLQRFQECTEDSGSEGCDIGRDWFDALTTIGLLERTQRSPALWTMTKAGKALIDASPKGGSDDAWRSMDAAPKSVADGNRVEGVYLLGFIPDDDLVDPQACIDVIWWEPLLPNSKGGRGKWCANRYSEACEVAPTKWQHLPNVQAISAEVGS